MIQLIGIGGEPATGKSELVRKLAERLNGGGMKAGVPTKWKTVEWLEFLGLRLRILGKYREGDTFPGTDRLSMAVQRDAAELLSIWQAPQGKTWTIVFEGDRLFNVKFANSSKALGIRSHWLVLRVDPKTVEDRLARRTDWNPKPAFIKGRRTKYANIVPALEAAGHVATELSNNVPRSRESIVDVLESWVRNPETDNPNGDENPKRRRKA